MEITKSEIVVDEQQRSYSIAGMTALKDELIVAGFSPSSRQALAAKIGANGNVKWQYFYDLLPEDKLAFGPQTAFPEFRDVLGLPDSSIFCAGY